MRLRIGRCLSMAQDQTFETGSTLTTTLAAIALLDKGRPGEKNNFGANNERTNLDVVETSAIFWTGSRRCADLDGR